MKIIKCLSELIEEELEDADKYIELALKWKADEPVTAELFHDLSVEEIGHMERLHRRVAELIENYRRENGDPPKEMMTLYDYLHKKHIGKATEVRIKQGMFQA